MRKTGRLDQIKKLQILKTFEYSYQSIALNFIIEFSKFTDLITQTSYDMIATIMNRFTKHAKFISCKTTMTAEQLTFLLLRTIFCKNDISEKIKLNRNKLFTFKFMKRLTQALEIKHVMSISFYSQTDEQMKRMNQMLKIYFKIYCSEKEEDWIKFLSTAQMMINFLFNEDMRSTSNEILHDRTLSQRIAISSFNSAACELIE